MKVCILGRGKVGRALLHALQLAGIEVTLRSGRGPLRKLEAADVYVLAVPDAALAALSVALGPLLSRTASVLHCAGARGHEVLAPARLRGAHVGAMHPLVSFADRRRLPDLRGATFVIQGDAAALKRARQLVRALGGHSLRTTQLGPAYHAAAALVANGAVALADSGLEILLALGFPRKDAQRALGSLLRSVADNVARVGLPSALTGPVVRGDVATVQAHIAALHALDPDLARHYASVQPLVIESASRAGLPEPRARALRRLLPATRRQRNT